VARMTPVEQPLAFKALYRVLLDREAGPKAGNLLAFLEREFVIRRCKELEFDKVAAWKETAITPEQLGAWMEKEKAKLAGHEQHVEAEGSVIAAEHVFTTTDGKRLLKRIIVEGKEPPSGVLV
jgi:hypothetical protein